MKEGRVKNLFIYLVFIFLYLPIIVLIIYSFNSSSMNILFENFTFDWYKALFHNMDLLESFRNTIVIAIISTLISTIIGTISAYGLYKFDFPFKDFINGLIYIPIVIPEIVLGISLLSIYTLVRLDLGIFSILLSHIAFSIPYVIVSIRSTLTSEIKVYEEAAKDLGASNYQIFKKIILPTISSGIVSGAILSFTLSLDDVVISYFTAGPGSNTLPLYIYSMIKTGITPDINALSTLLVLITFVSLISITIIQSRRIRKEVL